MSTPIFSDIRPGRVVRAPTLHVGPSQLMIDLAERILLKLLDQADSILADETMMAERAWKIAAAHVAQIEKRSI